MKNQTTATQPTKKLALSKESIRLLTLGQQPAALPGPTAIDCSVTC
jgi:hypothetical protein